MTGYTAFENRQILALLRTGSGTAARNQKTQNPYGKKKKTAFFITSLQKKFVVAYLTNNFARFS